MKSYPDSLSSLRRRYRKVRIPDWTGLVSLPLAFLSYLLLDVTLRYLFDGTGTAPASAFPPWLFTTMWALIFTCVAAFLPRLWRRIWLGVTFLFFAVECIAHAALYNLTGTFFSFASLSYAGDGAIADYKDWADRNGADEVIVFLTDYYVSFFSDTPTQNTASEYENWKFILVRTNGGEWEIVDQGY